MRSSKRLDRGLEDLLLVPEGEEDADELLDRLYVFPLDLAKRLGERTGELHRAFATPTSDPAFAPEPITAADVARWSETVRSEAKRVLTELESARMPLSEATQRQVEKLLDARATLDAPDRNLGCNAAAWAQDPHPWRLPSRSSLDLQG